MRLGAPGSSPLGLGLCHGSGSSRLLGCAGRGTRLFRPLLEDDVFDTIEIQRWHLFGTLCDVYHEVAPFLTGSDDAPAGMRMLERACEGDAA